MPILLRQFGNVQLPEVGLGTWKYHAGPEPLRHGLELGATLIDTAEAYGSEETVGEAIRGIRQKVFLATKASPRNFRKRDLQAAAEASLRRMGTDYIDLYQLHWPNMIVPIEETMGVMEDLVQQGKIRFIGLSNFVPSEIRRAQAALRKNKIFSNQVRYSLIDRTIENDVLEYCRQNQIAVIAFTPLGHGLDQLANMDPGDALGQVAKQAGKTRAQVALNWCLAQEGVITIPKASSPERVAENCGGSGWMLSSEQVQKLRSEIRFVRRSGPEMLLRRAAHYVFQRLGVEKA